MLVSFLCVFNNLVHVLVYFNEYLTLCCRLFIHLSGHLVEVCHKLLDLVKVFSSGVDEVRNILCLSSDVKSVIINQFKLLLSVCISLSLYVNNRSFCTAH